ncbi:MAG: hypothetical protein ACRDD8_07515, partial [Bacteroidales bacterium]
LIRNVLVEKGIHLQPSNTQRLYLNRDELGRGLCNVEQKSESMLLQLKKTLDSTKNSSLRRAAILINENNNQTHLFLIEKYLKIKYNLEELNLDILKESQSRILLGEIKEKTLHQKLFQIRENNLIDIKNTSDWLKSGNIKPEEEGRFCFIQDRNVFFEEKTRCPHCKESFKTIDHLATKCKKMLGHDYTRRHNEIVRCIHFMLSRKYNFKKTKKIRTHSVQEIIENEYAEIKVDTRIKTDIHLTHNRPDIFIYDKIKKEITLIEVGITCSERLNIVENEKLRKYDLLANELAMVYNAKTNIIPYVITWDGAVTKFHNRYIKSLGIQPETEAYIKTISLRKTLELISLNRRRGIEDMDEKEERVRAAINTTCQGLVNIASD